MEKDLMQVHEEQEKLLEQARREAALKADRLFISERKTKIEKEKLLEGDRSESIAKEADFNLLSDAQIDKMIADTKSYMEAARHKMLFIDETFNSIVPFHKGNFILIGGRTGEGKSTTVANVVRSVIQQKEPKTGRQRRALVITNEENSADLYNRITCNGRNWAYVNHENFTDKQIEIMADSLRYMASTGIVTIVDDSYAGATGVTTTYEGIKSIFDNMISKGVHYDVIIIDYLQKINQSRNDPSANPYEVQDKVRLLLDSYKNNYSGVIVALAQMKPPGGDDSAHFEHRMDGRKSICQSATFIMEIVRHAESLSTEWIVWKARNNDANGKVIWTGFDRGRFVPYTQEFKERAAAHLQEKEMQKIRNATGLTEKPEEPEEKKAVND
jgi:energy-coupling factor transporter ATP-binding protein EcfA2